MARTFYLVAVLPNPCDMERMRHFLPALKDELTRISDTEPEFAFKHPNLDALGFLVRSRMKASQINNALRSPGGNDGGKTFPFLTNSDTLIVVSIGDDFSVTGPDRSKGWTWYQRRLLEESGPSASP